MTQTMKGIRVLEVAVMTFVPAAGAILADMFVDPAHPEVGMDTNKEIFMFKFMVFEYF